MAQIALPVEFFIKERKQGYSNWTQAFWRELITNSLDGKSSIIDILVFKNADDTLQITFADNGTGMTREVCENVYLSIGRSTKDKTAGGVGGFGRARILTCFSMQSYTIQGSGYKVSGIGAEYEISEAPHITGLAVSVNTGTEASESHMRAALLQVITESRLPHITIRLNGSQLFTGNWTAKDSVPLSLDGEVFANAWFSPDLPSGSVLIRVNGMAMFRQYAGVSGAGGLVVELVPEKSREVLTANRDGMHDAYRAPIDALIREINQRGKSATQSKVTRTKEFWGRGDVKSYRSRKGNMLTEDANTPVLASDIYRPASVRPDLSGRGNSFVRGTLNSYTGRAMSFQIDSENEGRIALAKSWYPNLATPQMKQLYAAWESALVIALDGLNEVRPLQSLYWCGGLLFSDYAMANCSTVIAEDGSELHALCLNPLDQNLKIRYSCSKASDMQELLATAVHEVAHIFEQQHDTDYANLLTCIMAKVNWSSLSNIGKGVVQP